MQGWPERFLASSVKWERILVGQWMPCHLNIENHCVLSRLNVTTVTSSQEDGSSGCSVDLLIFTFFHFYFL